MLNRRVVRDRRGLARMYSWRNHLVSTWDSAQDYAMAD